MPNRTYVQMYIETGRYHYILKNRLYYMHTLRDAYQYLINHPEKVEELVKERVRAGKFTRGKQRTSFQWLILELQIISSWIWDEQFSGDTLCTIPVASEKREPDYDTPNPIYIPKHVKHRKKGRR